MVQQHAMMLAFVEAFWLMGVVFLVMLAFLPLLQYSKPKRATKLAAEAKEVVTPPAIPQDWHERLEPDPAYDEEHDFVLH
jgi:hypothetical protein